MVMMNTKDLLQNYPKELDWSEDYHLSCPRISSSSWQREYFSRFSTTAWKSSAMSGVSKRMMKQIDTAQHLEKMTTWGCKSWWTRFFALSQVSIMKHQSLCSPQEVDNSLYINERLFLPSYLSTKLSRTRSLCTATPYYTQTRIKLELTVEELNANYQSQEAAFITGEAVSTTNFLPVWPAFLNYQLSRKVSSNGWGTTYPFFHLKMPWIFRSK